ncbi:putative protein T-ENOL isoform X2 [Lemur catta]|uniref:putative protein T-ENOL isoform X2 n=1 Tax=Lemur catta TaxID=9447 RepID=UPI001E26B44D|nr:putative protein T-ENOL isoform X2 [Lemur catta]
MALRSFSRGGMASTPTRNEEKKGSRQPQAVSSSSGGGPKVSSSCSEEFLTRISTELADEALFLARCHVNTVPIKEKQTQDQGTQISRHVFFTKTRGTDTRACFKTPLLQLVKHQFWGDFWS